MSDESLDALDVTDSLPAEDTAAVLPSLDEARLVQQELERICKHRTFAHSKSLKAFLRFIVANSLENRTEELKEYVIATEVFGRDPSFDPSQKSIVRTQAVKLRSRLRDYYQGAEASGPVKIVLRPGGYIATFEHTDSSSRKLVSSAPEGNPEDKASLPLVSISAARSGQEPVSGRLEQFTLQLVIDLTARGRLQIQPAKSSLMAGGQDLSSSLELPSPQFTVTLMEQGRGDEFRLMIQIADIHSGRYAAGQQSEWISSGADLQELVTRTSAFIERSIYAELRRSPVGKNPDFEKLSLEGDYYLNRLMPADCQRALGAYETLLAGTSDDATAWAGTALAITYGAILGEPNLQRRKPAARVAAMHAIALDRWAAHSQLAYGTVRGFIDWRMEEAETYLANVLDVRPSCPFALMGLTLGCWIPRGVIRQSVDHLREAMKASPTSLLLHYALSMALYFDRQYGPLQTLLSKMTSLNGGPGHAAMIQSLLHLTMRDHLSEAYSSARQAEEHFGRIPPVLGLMGYITGMSGEKNEYTKIQSELEGFATLGLSVYYERALLKLGQRKHEEAVALLERAVRNKEFGARFLRVNPFFDGMEKIPSMQILLKQIE